MATTFSTEFEKATYGKVAWHLIPFLFLCYIVAFLDRVRFEVRGAAARMH